MSPFRVLIIEDEPSIADNILYALRSEGFEAQCCGTLGAGLDELRSGRYALLILDIGLPDGSGFELCKTLRLESDLPIIFLSARDSELDKVLGLELGADDYMVKPFSPRELVARVRARLRVTRPPVTSANGLILDEAAHAAHLNGITLALTRYEFRLLAVMRDQPGRVFSREQLLDLVWSDPAAAFDRTVDTHIKTLRQKLRNVEPANAMIRTHRGLGYSFQGASLS